MADINNEQEKLQEVPEKDLDQVTGGVDITPSLDDLTDYQKKDDPFGF